MSNEQWYLMSNIYSVYSQQVNPIIFIEIECVYVYWTKGIVKNIFQSQYYVQPNYVRSFTTFSHLTCGPKIKPKDMSQCIILCLLYIIKHPKGIIIKCAPFSRLSLTCARYLVPRISRLTLIGSFQVFTHRDIYVRSFAVRSLT